MGLEREGGNNAAVEGSLNAPQVGGGRASRRAAAAEVVEKTGRSFYRVDRCQRDPTYVHDTTQHSGRLLSTGNNIQCLTCRGSVLFVNIRDLLHPYCSLTHRLSVASLQH